MTKFFLVLLGMIPALLGARPDSNFGRAPLAFEPNQGQWSRPAEFGAHGRQFGAVFHGSQVDLKLQSSDVRLIWIGANSTPVLQAVDRLPGVSNYYRGSDPSKWLVGVSQYARLRAAQVYPGIDLVYYGHGTEIEYDLEVAPGADAGAVKLSFEGADELRIDSNGDLVISTKDGELVQHRPVIYQTHQGHRSEIAGHYAIDGEIVSILLGSYDHAQALVIDPVVSWGKVFSGSALGYGSAVAVDAAGNVYATGYSCPNTPCYFDAFLTKYSPDGATLVYSTYLGGSGSESHGLAVDPAGNAYLTGMTGSIDFPVKSAFQGALRGVLNAFLTKFTPSGAIIFSTYIGGSWSDSANAIALDASGNAYITGFTGSPNFPTVGAYQSSPPSGAQHVFVAKLSADGSSLLFSTYLGGNGTDNAVAIALGPDQSVYIAGNTTSTDFPTKNAFRATSTGASSFVTKLDPSGASLVYSTYFAPLSGGTSGDGLHSMDVDSAGSAYLAGATTGKVPLKGGLQLSTTGSSLDAFVTKLSPDGTSLVYSTYLGSSSTDDAHAIKVDSAGRAIVAGNAGSSDFPTYAAYHPMGGGGDGYVAQLNAAGDGLVYSTFLGAQGTEVYALTFDDNSTYLVGNTFSTTFPGTGAFLSVLSPFVLKLSGNPTPVAVTVNTVPPGSNVIVDGVTVVAPKTFAWLPGITHNLQALSPYSTDGATVNTFNFWSNGGSMFQTLTTPPSATTYTASFVNAPCPYSFIPTLTVGQAGTNFSVPVTTQQGCSLSAVSSAAWLTSSVQSISPGILSLTIAANPSGGTRTATLTLGTSILTVTQQYTVPSPFMFSCCGSGTVQQFSVNIADSDGLSDLTVTNILINNFLDGRQACYLAFDHQGRVLYLVNDAGTAINGMPFNSQGQGSGTLSNSQCSVDGSKTSIAPDSELSTMLTVGLVFSSGFAGNKVVYLAARDKEGLNSGWQPWGVWNVPGSSTLPAVVSYQRKINTQTIVVTYRDATNNANLSPSQILISDALDGRNACYIGYDHAHNLIYLVNDAGTALLPSVVPGGNGSQQNSQCIIYAGGSSVAQNGTDYTLTLNIGYLFYGTKIVYAGSQTLTGGNSGWQAVGAVMAP